ncbi:MAG: hypothetical protein IT307_14595 [Chloroflexi bacterium]|nr:hypothetical protein [Chloroflexota bacterium]
MTPAGASAALPDGQLSRRRFLLGGALLTLGATNLSLETPLRVLTGLSDSAWTPVLSAESFTRARPAIPSQPGDRLQGPLFGVLENSGDHLDAEWAAGLRVKTLHVFWDRAQPAGPSSFATRFWDDKRRELEALRRRGFQVILEPGTAFPPSWLLDSPGALYVNQYGDAWRWPPQAVRNVANGVFSPAVRTVMEQYHTRILRELGSDFLGIRVGGGFYNELHYPSNQFNGQTNCYWGFDGSAQQDCPVPGLKPGIDQMEPGVAQQFVSWYLGRLVEYLQWQVNVWRASFKNHLMLMLPGWGIRPGQAEIAIANGLRGMTSFEGNGSLHMGQAFDLQLQAITDPRIVAYTTWLDSHPELSHDGLPIPALWSPAKYVASLADRLGLQFMGENSGQNTPDEMKLCVERVKALGMVGMVWFSESELFAGQFASLDDYAGQIGSFTS